MRGRLPRPAEPGLNGLSGSLHGTGDGGDPPDAGPLNEVAHDRSIRKRLLQVTQAVQEVETENAKQKIDDDHANGEYDIGCRRDPSLFPK